MSQPNNILSVHPYFKVHHGKLEEFKAALPAFVAKAATEPGCLYYDFSINDDVVYCREAYVGADGFHAHLANVGPMLMELLKIADLSRLEIHGPAAELEKLKAPLAAMNPVWFTYLCGVTR